MTGGRALSGEQVARYERDGFLCPLPALSAAEAAACRARLEGFEASQGRSLARIPGQLRAKTHLLFPWLADLVRHPAVLAAVADLIGPDLLVYHLTMWISRPRLAAHRDRRRVTARRRALVRAPVLMRVSRRSHLPVLRSEP